MRRENVIHMEHLGAALQSSKFKVEVGVGPHPLGSSSMPIVQNRIIDISDCNNVKLHRHSFIPQQKKIGIHVFHFLYSTRLLFFIKVYM